MDLAKYDIKKPGLPSKKEGQTTSTSDGQSGWFEFLNKDIRLFGYQLNDNKKERFYSELNILFSAGVDIKTALELIEEEQSRKRDKEIFSKIREFVVTGGSLSDAIQQTGYFSPYEYYSIKIGEESGKLPEILEDLARFFSKKIAQKRQIVNAISYPAIVLLAAFGAIFFMMKFVVPMFSDVFKRFGGDLPYITKLIIRISEVFAAYSYFFIVITLGLMLFAYIERKKDWFRKITSRIILKLPIMGGIVEKIYLARFCHSMNLLIGAKTPLIESIGLVQKMVGFYPIESSLEVVKDKILTGDALHIALSEFPVYNRRMVALIKVAEEVNQLDVIFGKIAKQYSDEVEHQTGLISSLLEPFLIIFLGLFVAIILIAMYLPLFKLSSSFGY